MRRHVRGDLRWHLTGALCGEIYSDGWTLDIFRVPHGRQSRAAGALGPPVLVQHGFVDSSSGWLLNTPPESLALILADAGFDVWLGNNRGNSYSLQCANFSANDSRYWAFSFDEFATFDLPLEIELVLNVSGASSLSYIGVSQGTTQAFAAFSSDDAALAARVNLFIAFAPVVYDRQLSLLKAVVGVVLSAMQWAGI
jgi:pimeloyl-ACP methyl ester carboxylesterase